MRNKHFGNALATNKKGIYLLNSLASRGFFRLISEVQLLTADTAGGISSFLVSLPGMFVHGTLLFDCATKGI
jgi:hypothetical protein